MNVNRLWTEFMQLPFPDACAGEEVEGMCLVSLDSYTAGCISTFVDRGQLDPSRLDILRHCATELQRVLPKLKDKPLQYFTLLNDLVTATLQEVGGSE
jgi:hypothetical protein